MNNEINKNNKKIKSIIQIYSKKKFLFRFKVKLSLINKLIIINKIKTYELIKTYVIFRNNS